MTTRWVPLLGSNTRPDDSGNMFWEPTQLGGENLEELAATFLEPSGADVQLFGNFPVPLDYKQTSAKIQLYWYSIDFTPIGNVAWEFKYLPVSVGDSQADPPVETVKVATANPSPYLQLVKSTLVLTPGNFNPEDDVRFTLSRDDSDDTAELGVRLKVALFEYKDAA